jgi:hypothetical protein
LIGLEKIPSIALLEIQKYRNIVEERLSRIRSKATAIVRGRKKTEFSDWWLERIESLVNEYLTKCGYDHSALPHDYISQAPSDIKRVIENLKIVQSILKTSTPELREFLLNVSHEIYDVLNVFMSDIEFVLENLSMFEKLRIRVDISGSERHRLQADLTYLRQMRQMDEEFEARMKSEQFAMESIRLSDVVPVGGLIMARFHMCECELRTSLDLWGGEEGRIALRLEGIDKAESKRERDFTFYIHFCLNETHFDVSLLSFQNRQSFARDCSHSLNFISAFANAQLSSHLLLISLLSQSLTTPLPQSLPLLLRPSLLSPLLVKRPSLRLLMSLWFREAMR